MAYEAQIEQRVGDKNPLYGTANTETGTLTFVDGDFTLYDAAGEVVDGFDGVALTDNDGPAAEINVWYNMDWAGFSPAVFYAILKWGTLDSEGLPRTHQSDIEIVLLPAVERPSTHDLTTKVGQLRWWLNDHSSGFPGIAAQYSDAELTNYLIMSTLKHTEDEGIPILAAALLYDKLANDAARVASMKQIAIFRTDTRSIPEQLRIAADRLRALYAAYGSVDPGDELIDENGVAAGVGVVGITYERITRYNPATEPFW